VRHILLIVFSLATLVSASFYKVSLQLPLGVFENATMVEANSTVYGVLTVESLTNEVLHCGISIRAEGCALLNGGFYNTTLVTRYDSRTYQVGVYVGNAPCVIEVASKCNGAEVKVRKLLLPRARWNVTVDLVIPSDTACRQDPKYERFVVVVKPTYTPTLIRLITGEAGRGHPDLLTLACLKLYGPGFYTAALLFQTPDGRPVPVSTAMIEERGAASSGTITLSGINGSVVFPIFTPYPESLAGSLSVTVFVYPYGSSKPVLNKMYVVRVISTRGEAMALAVFSAAVALPAFFIITARFLKKSQLKDVVLSALLGCLMFAVVTIPGQVLWGIGALLGPFDWVVYGVVYDALLYMLYTIAVALRPRPGTLTFTMFINWVMNSLFFGRLSVISALWLATSALFFESALYLLGVTRGRVTLPGILIALAAAGFIDRYVDLLLYMALYRLYYADWYLAVYTIGNTIYTIPGIILGFYTHNYLKGVAHE